MNLVDSCGWLEYLADSPRADFYAPAIQDFHDLLVPTICICEVFRKVSSDRGETAALQAVASMAYKATVVDLDVRIAVKAAALGTSEGLPLADSIIVATARLYDAVIWTQDKHLKNLDGVRYLGAEHP